MAYKKLKSYASTAVTEAGDYVHTPTYGKPPQLDVYIETTGKLRMFIILPDFMGDVVGRYKKGSVEIERVAEKKGGREVWALIGRDPETLQSAWRELCALYVNEVKNTELEPVILIKHTHRSFHYSSGPNTARIEIDFDRYLRNKRKPSSRHDMTVKDFEWNDELQPKKSRGYSSVSDGDQIVPYTPELWESLCRLRDQIRAAQQRYDELVRSGDIVPRLLSGRSILIAHEK